MTDDASNLKLVIPPQVLAQLQEDLTPEEVEELLADLSAKLESGELFEESTPVNMSTLEADDPELYEQIVARMKADGFDSFDDLDDWVSRMTAPPTLN